jgi:WS/DGAT/MGAT family acyltransferase
LHGHQGVDFAMLFHDLLRHAPKPPPPQPWFPAAPPRVAEVLLRAVKNNVTSPIEGPRPLVRAMSTVAPRLLKFIADAIMHPEDIPDARFNAEVSPHRVFDTRRFLQSQIDEIRTLVRGATADDVVLAACGGALRRYLQLADELPSESLVALAPPRLQGTADAAAGLRRVSLQTHLDSPLERLRRIAAASAAERRLLALQSGKSSVQKPEDQAPAAVLSLAARTLTAAAQAAGRGVTIANCTIVNAPGPGVPLFLQGARLTYFSALTPIADGLGLTIAVTSYDGRLLVSPTACREQMPDPAAFAQLIRDCFEEYLAMARRRAAAPRAGQSGSRRRASVRAAR